MTGKKIGHSRCCAGDAIPLMGEADFEHGARHVCSFHGASYHASKTDDGLRILRGGDSLNGGTQIAFFEGEDKWRAEPSEEGRGLHVYEVDPSYTGLDRPSTIVHGSARDSRAHAREQLQKMQRRADELWAEENRKLAERTDR
jgi:hypothetical protein